MEDEKGPGGRPTKFDESLIDQAYKLSLLGATDEQIAAFFEVAVSTIYLWKTMKILETVRTIHKIFKITLKPLRELKR